MGWDITVEKSYVLHSGKLLNMGSEDLEEYRSCNLINPDMWYQKECFFLPGWAKKHLEPVEGAEYDDSKELYNEYKLPLDKVQLLITECNTALKYRNSNPKVAAAAIRPLFDDKECVFSSHYDTGYNQDFFDDLYKVASSMGHLLTYLGQEEDVLFTFHFGY